MKGLLLVVIAM